VVAEGCKPELGDAGGVFGIFGERRVSWIVLERRLFACFNFFGCRLDRTANDSMSAIIQRLLQFEVLDGTKT
jgi:hypothetical protein